MTTDRQTSNKATVQRVLHASNTHDEQLIAKAIEEVFRPDVVLRTPLPVQVTGVEAIKDVFATLDRAFPDLVITVEDLIEEGDKVVARNTVTGTHQGEYMGRPATGRSVTYNEVIILRFVDGRVAETWAVVDVLSQLRQLGMIPT